VVIVGVLRSLSELLAETVEQSAHPDTPWHCLPFPASKGNQSGQRSYSRVSVGSSLKFGCGPRVSPGQSRSDAYAWFCGF